MVSEQAPEKMRAGSLESKTTRIKAERLECKKESEEEKNEGLGREERKGRGEERENYNWNHIKKIIFRQNNLIVACRTH